MPLPERHGNYRVVRVIPPPQNQFFEMISVVMISMNEEKAVGQVIADIRTHAPDAEILLVDSSKDRTPEIAEQAGARVIRRFPPQGYGKAMEIALRSGKGDVII